MKNLLCLLALSVVSLVFAQGVEKIDISNWDRPDSAYDEAVDGPRSGIDRDTYENARRNSYWCPTETLWEARRQAMGLEEMSEAACPTQGVCDDPAVRDATSTASKAIHIYVHLVRNTNGTGGVNINNAIAAYNTMLADYAGTGISYKLVGAQWINNSTYATIPAYSPFNLNWLNAINNMKLDYALYPQYICNIFVSAQQPSAFGTLLGIATFPWDPEAPTKTGGLWMNNVAMTGSSHTFAHELGHCFGLWHTHHGVSEVPSCSACYEFASGFEGDERGDFCSDTPPTPTNFTCSPPGGVDCEHTPWGPTQPENFMSYAPDSCQNLFTQQQVKRMHCWVPDALPLWVAP